MALLAALVIFTVIARYCFSLSWKQLAEFNTTLFAFTTFWGMGINVIKDEHVMIDILYDGVKPARKRWLAIVNYLIVLAVVLVFTYQGFKYALKLFLVMRGLSATRSMTKQSRYFLQSRIP